MEQAQHGTNKLLSCLSIEGANRIIDASRPMELPSRTRLFERDVRPRNAYFLTGGIASIVFTSVRGRTIELATIGAEGMVGSTFLLGPSASMADSVMQVSGSGYCVPMKFLEKEFHESSEFNLRMLEFVQHQSLQADLIVACNRLHGAEARFSRWLLMVQDRLGTDTIPMTQEFLSNMLGTRRTTVAEVSAALARLGALENKRGIVHILDRSKLEAHTCECYPLLRKLYDSLYQAKPVSAPMNGSLA